MTGFECAGGIFGVVVVCAFLCAGGAALLAIALLGVFYGVMFAFMGVAWVVCTPIEMAYEGWVARRERKKLHDFWVER